MASYVFGTVLIKKKKRFWIFLYTLYVCSEFSINVITVWEISLFWSVVFVKCGTGISIHINVFPILPESFDKVQSQRSYYFLLGINKHVMKSVSWPNRAT